MQDQIGELEAFGEMDKTHSLIAVLQTVSKASKSKSLPKIQERHGKEKKYPSTAIMLWT